MNYVKDKCKMKHGLIIPSEGKSGGLALLWREGITVDVQTYSQLHVDALVDGGANIGWWHFISFYGNPDTAKWPESWAKLRQLKGTSTLLWLIMGDFNQNFKCFGKVGGQRKIEIADEEF